MNTPKTILLSALVLLASTGCSTMHRAMKVTQDIAGTGSISIETPLNMTTVSVENARQDSGRFHADRIDIVHKGKWTQTRVEIHGTEYSRALVDVDKDGIE